MNLGLVPPEVSFAAELDGFTVQCPGPPGRSEMPAEVGLVAVGLLVLAIGSGWLYGLWVAVAVLVVGGGVAGAGMARRRGPGPVVRVEVRGVRLRVRQDPLPPLDLLLSQVQGVRAGGWALEIAEAGGRRHWVALCNRPVADWLAAVLRAQLETPGEVPPALSALMTR